MIGLDIFWLCPCIVLISCKLTTSGIAPSVRRREEMMANKHLKVSKVARGITGSASRVDPG